MATLSPTHLLTYSPIHRFTTTMFWAIYLIVVFVALAMMVREGLWSNAITLVNIVISGVVAFGFYSPLVIYLDEMTDGQNTYWLDFVVIWALFVVTMLVTRAVTGAASRTRMRFKNPIDPVGGPLVGLIAGWVLAAFVMATLHTSPMPRDAFSDGLVKGDQFATATTFASPDAAWLRFMERVADADALGNGAFKAEGFVKIYERKRENFQSAPGIRVRRG